MKFSTTTILSVLAFSAKMAEAGNLRAEAAVNETETTRELQSCSDGHRSCGYWASVGECSANPNYMLSKCKKSCGECIDVGHYYQFKRDGDYCLDVPRGRVANFASLQLYRCNGTDAQKFRFDSSGRLRSKINPSYCVEMDPRYGVFLHNACIDSWALTSTDHSGVFIKNTKDAQCIAVKGEWESGNGYDPRNGKPIERSYCDSDYAPQSEWNLF